MGIRRHPEFTTTRWTVVLRAGSANPVQANEALDQLCRDYWYPLYAYARRKLRSPEEAADVTQDFFAKLLEKGFASGLRREGGRFRSFLLTALNRFMINEWQKGQRQKRGGGMPLASIHQMIVEHGEESYVAELSHHETPEQIFQRTWAEVLLGKVLERLAKECRERNDGRFPMLRPFLAAGGDAPSLEGAAEALGLSVPAFKSLLHRFRARYRELLLEEVGQTVESKEEAAEELRALAAILRQ